MKANWDQTLSKSQRSTLPRLTPITAGVVIYSTWLASAENIGSHRNF